MGGSSELKIRNFYRMKSSTAVCSMLLQAFAAKRLFAGIGNLDGRGPGEGGLQDKQKRVKAYD